MSIEFEKEDKSNFLKQFKFNPNSDTITQKTKEKSTVVSMSPDSLIIGILIFFSLTVFTQSYKNTVAIDNAIKIQQQAVQNDSINLLNSFNQQFYNDVLTLNNDNLKNNTANSYFTEEGLKIWNQLLENRGIKNSTNGEYNSQLNIMPTGPARIINNFLDNNYKQNFSVNIPVLSNHTFNDKTLSLKANVLLSLSKNPDLSSPHKFLINNIRLEESFVNKDVK